MFPDSVVYQRVRVSQTPENVSQNIYKDIVIIIVFLFLFSIYGLKYDGKIIWCTSLFYSEICKRVSVSWGEIALAVSR